MSWTRFQLFLILTMVISGTFNTITSKWSDRLDAEGFDGHIKRFMHPFFQTVIMFLGEIACLLLFKSLFILFHDPDDSENLRLVIRGNQNFTSYIFLLPALCDLTSTSLMYMGLSMSYASSFQMLRGSLIIFVALLSVGFLGRKINWREISGIIFVITGLVIVGISDFFFNTSKDTDSNAVITGDMLIILAQIITAVQVVLEEHFVSGKDIPPLQAVGLEGCFGFIIMGFLLIPLYYIPAQRPFGNGRLEDLRDALTQIKNNPMLLVPLIGNAVSIAFFNFAGVSVTKEMSATTRTVLDSLRTFFVWMVTLALKWQQFSALQLLGFMVLLLGIFTYNDILIPNIVRKILKREPRGSEILVNEDSDEMSTP